MSEKNVKTTRRVVEKNKRIVARQLIEEIMDAKFSVRFRFCMKVLFGKRKKGRQQSGR